MVYYGTHIEIYQGEKLLAKWGNCVEVQIPRVGDEIQIDAFAPGSALRVKRAVWIGDTSLVRLYLEEEE